MNPAAAPLTLVTTIGPDGAGKTTFARALAAIVGRQGRSPTEPRPVQMQGHWAEVFEWRGTRVPFQHVDFANVAAQHALLGMAQFAGAIVVVSALDAVVPDTVRSLEQARALGIRRLAVAITRCDQVEDPEMVDLVQVEAAEAAKKYFPEPLGSIVTVRCSPIKVLHAQGDFGEGVAQLADAIDHWA